MQKKIQAVTCVPSEFGGLIIKNTVTYSDFLIETAKVPTELQYFQA